MKYITASAASIRASTNRLASSVSEESRSYVRNTSTPTMRIKPIQTSTYDCMVGPCPAGVAVMVPPSTHVHQVDEREHEHPDQIDEVPVQGRRLDVVGVEPAAPEAGGNHTNDDYAADDVQQVQTGDAEERGSEQRGPAQRILEQPPPLADHGEPLPQVQRREDNSQQHGGAEPAEGRGRTSRVRGHHSRDHGQTAGQQYDGHHAAVDNSGREGKRPRPVRVGEPEEAVGEQDRAERGGG